MRSEAIDTHESHSPFSAALFILATSAALSPSAAAHETVLASAWRESSAIGEEHLPSPVVLDNERVAIAVSNDGRFLFLSLATHDRSLFYSMYRDGMTLWIDSKGGRRETLGIRYPIGIEGDPVSELRGPGGDRKPASTVPPDHWLEIVGTGVDDPRRVAFGDIHGLDIRMTENGDTYVYEAKVPLVTSDDGSLVVGAGVGRTIGVGWKTDRPKSEDLAVPNQAQHGGMRVGSHGGAGGRSHGGGSRAGSGGGTSDGVQDTELEPKRVKPLRLWVKVRLAAPGVAPADAHAGD
jgi:hypothetical protein